MLGGDPEWESAKRDAGKQRAPDMDVLENVKVLLSWTFATRLHEEVMQGQFENKFAFSRSIAAFVVVSVSSNEFANVFFNTGNLFFVHLTNLLVASRASRQAHREEIQG